MAGVRSSTSVAASGPCHTPAGIDRYPPIRHPIVGTHPLTGRKCRQLMRDNCVGIEGVDAKETEAPIAARTDHIVKPTFNYRYQWRRGDRLMWDDCTVPSRITTRRRGRARRAPESGWCIARRLAARFRYRPTSKQFGSPKDHDCPLA
jgi:hypothetical protein